MKKRLVAFVFALALIFCALPMTSVHALTEDEFKEEVKNIFPDPVLAEVVYTAILNSEAYDATKSALENIRAFEGDISYSGTDSKFIKDLTGIENFVHASISFTNQSLTDLSPMGNFSEDTNKSIKVSNSPIHIWPVDFPDKADDTFAVPTPFACFGHAIYLYNDSTKTQTVTYDVYTKGDEGTSPVPIDVTATSTGYVLSGGVSVKNGQTKPEAEDTDVVFEVVSDGTGIAAISYNAQDYWSAGAVIGGDHHVDNVSYGYTLDSKFYYTVKAESYTLGWFYLGKFDESDTAHEHPLGGAKFEIYNDEGTCIEVVTTEEGKYTKVEGGPGGLPAGTYTIKEVEAPEDYLVSSETMTVTVPSVSGVTVSGGKDSLDITKDEATWTPEWETGFVENGGSTKNIALVTSDVDEDVTASSKGVDAFIANKSADQDAGFASGSNPFTITPDAGVSGGAVVTMGTTEVGTYGSIEAAQAAVRDLIANDKVTGNITITINADATSFPDEKAPFVYFMDKETPPQTGDSAMIIAAVVGLIAAGAGLVIFARKRVAKAN